MMDHFEAPTGGRIEYPAYAQFVAERRPTSADGRSTTMSRSVDSLEGSGVLRGSGSGGVSVSVGGAPTSAASSRYGSFHHDDHLAVLLPEDDERQAGSGSSRKAFTRAVASSPPRRAGSQSPSRVASSWR